MSGGDWKEMFDAALRGDLELLDYHVQAGVDVNYAHPEFLSTPLVAALLAGQEAAALVLLAAGADPRLRSEFDGLTPMQAARRAGLAAVEDRLLALGVAPLPATSALPALPAPRYWLGRLLAGRRVWF